MHDRANDVPSAEMLRTFFYIDLLSYGTHGNFVVMDGPTWDDYYEFPPR